MRFLILLLMALAGHQAAAAPCFHPGDYSGRGFGWDSTGAAYPYKVSAQFASPEAGSSQYQWQQGSANIVYERIGDKLLINGQDNGSTVVCDMSSVVLNIKDSGAEVREEWTFVGNYLIRRGTKTVSGAKVEYQELLVRN